MAQRVFSFHSPVDNLEMIRIIERVVSELKGKTKIEGNIVKATWWSKNTTTFPHKFEFYVGKDLVRVVTGDLNEQYKRVKWEYGLNPLMKLWNVFVDTLLTKFPDLDFELRAGKMNIVAAKIMSDGMMQVMSSTSVSKPSITGALIGGALFGGVGAIVGGSRTKTKTSGSTRNVFSSTVLVVVRYSNGFTLEGEILKKSSVYNRITAGLCEVSQSAE